MREGAPTLQPARRLTDFEQILVAMLGERPMSGYALRRHFRTTPAQVYEPSGGALYPALRRLEARGLLRAEAESAGRRSRRVYAATPAGREATVRWVREPVDPATVGRDLGLHLMRFVIMERLVPPADVQAFLTSLLDALSALVAGMERYVEGTALPGRHPRLAIEHGLAAHRASLAWARSAKATLESTGPARVDAAR